MLFLPGLVDAGGETMGIKDGASGFAFDSGGDDNDDDGK